MKFLVVLSSLMAVAFAKPGFLGAPLGYAAIVPGAPIGPDGRVVDTPEVNLAKAEHAAAHINERINLGNEFLRSAEYITPAGLPIAAPLAARAALPIAAPALPYASAALPIAAPALPIAARAALPIAAPLAYSNGIIAADGRPLDTAEVTLAKASHAAAHLNERLVHANEFARNVNYGGYLGGYF